jgi:hypothetical protein
VPTKVSPRFLRIEPSESRHRSSNPGVQEFFFTVCDLPMNIGRQDLEEQSSQKLVNPMID